MKRLLAAATCAFLPFFFACAWDPTRPFDRESPAVGTAIALLDAGEGGSAAKVLEEYLSTGPCKGGNIGTPITLRDKAQGSFDLGLALFQVGEGYGRRFGEEERGEQSQDERRRAEVDCALRIVRMVAEDPSQPLALRLRARFLEGNLQFLGREYEEAVRAYDAALVLLPAAPDSGDRVSEDVAYNRAIALRRIEEKAKDSGASDGATDGGKDAAQDHEPDRKDAAEDAPQESGKDAKEEAGRDSGYDGGDSSKEAGGGDSGEHHDKDAEPPPQTGEDAAPPPPRKNQDDRILDMLENAPTVQQEAAKRQAGARRVRGMADK